VVFNPVIGGKASQPVEFTRVLHVPLLQNNLLSCLYLAKHKGIKIHINSQQMDFSVLQLGLPTVPTSLVPLNHLLSLPTGTLPLTLSLWHRCCCHHNLADITKMHKEGLVTGMTGVAERANQTLADDISAMLSEAKLPPSL